MQQRNGEPASGTGQDNTEAMSPRQGMDRPCCGREASQGADAAHTVFNAGSGGGVASRTAPASQGHGDLRSRHRAQGCEHNRTDPWQQVDLARKQAWVHPDQAKARKAIPVPFNEAALEVVSRQQGKHPVHVFTYEGNPVRQVSTRAWYKALRRAGIGAFRFHDLRQNAEVRKMPSCKRQSTADA